MLSSTDRAAIYRTLALTPVVDDIQAALDARPGPPLAVSVHDALFAIIAAALIGPGHASRLDRSSRNLRDWHDDDDQLRNIHDLVFGDDASHLAPEDRPIEVRKHYRRFRRTLEAIGIWCKGETDGISNYDHLAYTLLLASTPVHARAYTSYACDSAGVQAAYRSNGATKVRNRLRQATARIRNYGNNSERERVRKMLFGFGYHFLGRFDPTGKDKTLWVAMVRLTPGSTSEVRTLESMLGTVAALGQPIMDLFAGDRAYSNSPHLRRIINAMHGDLVADLLDHQARPYRRPDGCWVYGGGLYDPATPPHLFNRPRRTPNMPLLPWLEKNHADLGPYLLAEHTQPDIHGAHRHVGNCVRYGADCALRPDLFRLGGPTYPHAPATSQPLCAGGTTQSTRDDYDIPKAKGNGTIPTYQPLPYGTYQHAAVYHPWRSRTEGALGTITEYHGMWGGRHGFKVRNFDVLQLLALAAGVAYNLRRRGYAPSDHGTEDCKDESVLVLPVEHESAFQRKLAARRRLREAFDPTTCREHQHPPARNLLRLDDDASDPPAA